MQNLLKKIHAADYIVSYYTQPEPRSQHRWIVVRKSDNIKIGTCGFHGWNNKDNLGDIGYDLKERFWGNGYMQESLHEIIKFAKNKMAVNEICANIFVDNHKSISLVGRLNFVLTGIYYEIFRNEKYVTTQVVSGNKASLPSD